MRSEEIAEPTDGELLGSPLPKLRRILSEARAAGETVALLVVHCGGIERVDARQGYHAGSLLSESIENLLRTTALRKRDIVEPLSRADYACVLRPIPSEGIAVLAAHRIIATLENVPLDGQLLNADVSVGITLCPDHGVEADLLLQRAKAAQQSALGMRERLRVFAESDAGPAFDPSQYETRLRLALQRNAFHLAFQPQLDLRSGRIAGAEALLRWQDEVLGPVPPNRAVAAAEAAGLMDELTLWVVTSAIQWCARFARLDPAFTVSINISPSNLREPDLPQFIDRALRTWGVNGANIVVEITETAMVVDQHAANEAMGQLRARGVRLSIDDFGTGYSSMYYLAQLPLEELKIDLMFVRDMLTSPVHAKIVRSLIELAHNLELTVVAEGVETKEVLEALRHLGCDRVQGYYIGKPVPPSEMLQRINSQG